MRARKILKIVGGVVGALALLAVGAIIVKFYVLSPEWKPAPQVTAPSTPEAIARGSYLANNVTLCIACHSTPGKIGAGNSVFPYSDFPGTARIPNITPDKETGIGAWTDGEVMRAIREGVKRDNKPLFPMMPYPHFANVLTDEDTLAIVGYLRTLAPIKNDPGKFEVSFPLSMIARSFPGPLEKPPTPEPPVSEKKARGDWLLKAGLCGMCHNTFDANRQTIPGMRLAGGMKVELPDGKGYITAPNITSDKATGIGAYSDDDIRRVLDEGVGKAGPLASRGMGLPYEMPWAYFKGMTNEDKEALIFALREVPAVSHLVPPSVVRK